MNVKEYISSGILELYVLGSLSETQRKEVERYASEYPEVRAELDKIEQTIIKYAQSKAIPVSSAQQVNILDAIDKLNNSTTNSDGQSATNASKSWQWIPLAVAILAIGAAIYFFIQQQQLATELSSIQSEMATQTAACDSLQGRTDILENQLNALFNPATDVLILEQEDTEDYAVLYRNLRDELAYLDISKLPTPPTGKQYQLWYISEGTPSSMGVFDLGESLLEIDLILDAQAFAISLENTGGSPTPTDVRFIAQV
ncbi:MAG: anti-sigma factor [Bacteroidota bacterium]